MDESRVCQSPVIVALDYEKPENALALVSQLDPRSCRLKVGKQLFTIAGPEFVKSLIGQGYEVFLDLKFHDIPNTVASACRAAAELGVWMLNVHASGGRRMMEAAKAGVDASGKAPLLIGVTVLTSMTDKDLHESGVERSVAEQVDYLSGLVFECGLDGVVCSAQEASGLKQKFADGFCLVTPGIRTADSAADDQRRVMTPLKAVAAGADYLVIGRSITASDNPLKTLNRINLELGVPL
ncbi:MAG: orotidine-5'-phosphate decarboxylase [Gammaproteobacteria bacterium]|nr:orotidine-5'-phosphate decarboxylase [Gammaproteobacteria bacterium]